VEENLHQHQLKQLERLKRIEEMKLDATEQAARQIYLLTAEFLRRQTGCLSCQNALLQMALDERVGTI